MELDIKRFPIGIRVFTFKCPNCNEHSIKWTDKNDYISYPKIDEPNIFYFCCPICEDGVEIDVKLNIELEFDTKNPRKQ